MSQSYKKVILSEFSDMMRQRKSMNMGSFSINDIVRVSDLTGEEDENVILQIPDFEKLITENDLVLYGQKSLGFGCIRGIVEPYFSELNGEEVEIAKEDTFYKRISIYENDSVTFRKDKEGNYVTKPIYLEDGFVGIFSKKNIHLPNRIEKNGVKREYVPTRGYNYVDFVDIENCRKYLYTVPMETVYKMELCALVLSLEKKSKITKKFFKGSAIALKNGFYAYLFVVPYANIAKQIRLTENMYGGNIGDVQNYKILGMKSGINFNEEVKELLDLWKEEDRIFDLEKTVVCDESMYDAENFGIVDLEANLELSDYHKIGEPLKNLEFEEEESVESE